MENIAFVGKMAAGKSYYAELLRQELMEKGINANRVSISAKIKEIATDLFSMDGKDRLLLQKIAGKMREIDDEVWIKHLISSIKKNDRLPFIIDDLRFSNEVSMLRDNFSLIVVKIESDDGYRKDAYFAKYWKTPTEAELNDITETSTADIVPDITLENDYTLPTARGNVRKILKAIGM